MKLDYRNFRLIYLSTIHVITFVIVSATQEEPEFTDIIENITVAAGRNVKFACSVKNLGTYKVGIFVSKMHLIKISEYFQVIIRKLICCILLSDY